MIENLLSEINSKDYFNYDETFSLYKKCSELIIENENDAQKLIVNILDEKNKFDTRLNPILTDLIESVGFYPYLEKEHLTLDSTDALIRHMYHYSNNLNKYLHEDQKHLLSLLNSEKNVIVSAPTSFGKSLLIEEIVASKKFKNIVIIQPTLALLDETRRKLKKYDENYKLIVRTSQDSSIDKGNIYLFTAERVNEYKKFLDIDFIILDEFYKLSSKRDDERADSLNNALYYILKTFNCKFYLLGPNIDGISKGFAEKYNAIFYKTQSSLVDVKSVDIYSQHKEKFDQPKKYKEYKEKVLFDLLLKNKDHQSIIYCSSPSRVRYLSKRFYEYLREKYVIEHTEKLDIIEWIQENISSEWSLINLLKSKIGIHDGALQKHITTTIIDYFNKGYINYLFCTTTIIEGVNTSAKNIIYFDSTKGTQAKIDYFDYSNIKGRAGRLMVHYTGIIFNFKPIPPNEQIVIDIPFYEQNPISDEILINLEEHEIIDKTSDQYKSIKQLPKYEKDVIRNNGVQVFGQKSIIEQLRTDIHTKYNLIAWSKYPTKEQLTYVISLAWNNLLKPTETVRPMTLKGLVTVTQIYGYNQNIWNLVNNTFTYLKSLKNYKELPDNEIMDDAIRQSFQTLKHWFEYKVPKWLSVIDSLQNFVCVEKGLRPGSYSYFSNLIENDFLRENLTILAEYGIPSSAIRKLEKLIPAGVPQDDVINIIRKEKLFDHSIFIDYEKNKLKDT
ncbi:DEAD/DEAH box helicase [Sphingobacterium sp. SGL-16]|uniref:DEAD/DEAH box helicase n=1 Tax=Sphingobacterium sp. SGL-16 TaxID=2710883 RepID=UPI0013EAA404|nr:DEAD/DEAH box helicase [Sphingobacterium sp. SGL-16]NGM72223.1 DEAD/DEAH box helicase [Sphingobacterium sp. SGL-16]